VITLALLLISISAAYAAGELMQLNDCDLWTPQNGPCTSVAGAFVPCWKAFDGLQIAAAMASFEDVPSDVLRTIMAQILAPLQTDNDDADQLIRCRRHAKNLTIWCSLASVCKRWVLSCLQHASQPAANSCFPYVLAAAEVPQSHAAAE
jgi:hypothetical protein